MFVLKHVFYWPFLSLRPLRPGSCLLCDTRGFDQIKGAAASLTTSSCCGGGGRRAPAGLTLRSRYLFTFCLRLTLFTAQLVRLLDPLFVAVVSAQTDYRWELVTADLVVCSCWWTELGLKGSITFKTCIRANNVFRLKLLN